MDRIASHFASKVCPLALLIVCSCGGGGGSGSSAPEESFEIEDLTLEVAEASATLAWRTDLPTDALVEYGETPSYGLVAAVGGHAYQHQVTLSGLDAEKSYHFRVRGETVGGDVALTADATFTTPSPTQFTSDDFREANLNLGIWRLDDPEGEAQLRLEGSGSTDAQLVLAVPDGVEYLAWDTNGAARVTQAIPDQDLVLEACFENGLSASGTGNGLLFEEDDENYLRFDFAFNSGKVQVFAAYFQGGALGESYLDLLQWGAWPEGQPLWMRVERSGDLWTQRWSQDGAGWIDGAVFTYSLAARRAGVQVITAGEDSNAHTARVDYVFDVAAPLSPEDAPPGEDQVAPFLYRFEGMALSDTAVELEVATDELTLGTLRFGQDDSHVEGSVALDPEAHRHLVHCDGLLSNTDYHFLVELTDAWGNQTTSQDLVVRTFPDGTNGAPGFTMWYGEAGQDGSWVTRFGHLGDAQPQINVLGRVYDADEDRIPLTVTLSYQLNGGAWQSAALGDDPAFSYDPWRLAGEGDFNVELFVDDLTAVPPVGGVYRNQLLLEAIDDDGHVTYQTVWVDYTAGVDWAPNYAIDWSATPVDDTDLQDLLQVVDGDWRVVDDPLLGPGLRVAPGELGYDRLVAVGQGHGAAAWEDYELLCSATVLSLDPEGWTAGTKGPGLGFGLRWSGHTPGWGYPQPNHDIYPLGAIFMYRWFETSERWELWINYDEAVIPLGGSTLQIGQTYHYRVRCETQGGGGTRYRLRWWPEGYSEPDWWDFDYTTPAEDDHPAGSLLFVSHHVDVHLGNVSVSAL